MISKAVISRRLKWCFCAPNIPRETERHKQLPSPTVVIGILDAKTAEAIPDKIFSVVVSAEAKLLGLHYAVRFQLKGF